MSVQLTYLLTVVNSASLTDLYISATKIPAARREYIMISNALFLSFFDADALGIDKRDILMASTVASAGEFEMVCSIAERPDELNFDYAMSYPFKARMYLLQVEREEADALYREALQVGIKQYKELQ